MKDFLEFVDRLSPMRCRILALKGRKPISTAELAKLSGLSESTIKALSRADSWEPWLRTFIAFNKACGVDPTHQKRAIEKLKRMMASKRGPIHLRGELRRYYYSILAGEKQWRTPSK